MKKILRISRIALKAEQFSTMTVTLDGEMPNNRETSSVVQLLSLLL